jgi:hypothetical protein
MCCNKPRVEKTCPSWSMDMDHGKAVIFLVLTSILSFCSCSGKPSARLVNGEFHVPAKRERQARRVPVSTGARRRTMVSG